MAALAPSEDWNQSEFIPSKSARRVFVAPGYADETAAVAAVMGKFGTRPGTAHPKDGSLYVQLGGIRVVHQKGPTTWEIAVTYGYLAKLFSIGQDVAPLQRPTTWQIEWGEETTTTDIDSFGNAITNSAGSQFDYQAQRSVRTLFIIARKFYSNYTLDWSKQFMNKVNAVPVQVKSLGAVPRGGLKCKQITPVGKFILSDPTPIEVVHQFQIAGEIVTGIENDPGFKIARLDSGKSGWWIDSHGVYRQGDFVIPDPTNPTNYIAKNTETLLDGRGLPIPKELALGVKVGTPNRSNPATPVAPPERLLPNSEQVERVKRKGDDGPVVLLYNIEKEVDFASLFAIL